jgi:hypothetical protein
VVEPVVDWYYPRGVFEEAKKPFSPVLSKDTSYIELIDPLIACENVLLDW